MSSVGSHLRELRERRGVSLEEIARSTRVLPQYLEALEADDYAALPAPAFTRGFVRAYCQALGVPSDEAVALYGERVAASGHTTKAHAPDVRAVPGGGAAGLARRKQRDGSGRGAVLASFLMLVVLGLSLFALTFWLGPSRDQRGESHPVSEQRVAASGTPETPKVAAPVDAPVPGPPASAPRPEPSVAPAPTPPGGAAALAGVTAPYRLVARTSELTWIRVRTEDGWMSEENIPAGETREWVSNRPFVLTIGNAAGVALELNGRRVPLLGARGAVIERLVLPSEAR